VAQSRFGFLPKRQAEMCFSPFPDGFLFIHRGLDNFYGFF
jgi:hypothetical protein